MVRSLRRAVTVGVLVGVTGCGLGVAGLSDGASRDGGVDASGVAMLANLGEASTSGDATQNTGGDDGMTNADAESEGGAQLGDDADQGPDGADDAGGSIDAGQVPDASQTIDAGGPPPVDAGQAGQDGATGSTGDAGHDAGQVVDAGGPPPVDAGGGAGPCTNTDAGCVVVPTGWELVAFAPSQATACPTGFGTPTNLVEGPNASSACGCGTCTTSTQPTCTSGAVGLTYDTKSSGFGAFCIFPSTSLANSPAGACSTSLAPGAYDTYYLEFTAPAASGGVCAAPTTTGTVTYAASDRTCTPTSLAAANCSGGACAPTLTGPYEACITPTAPGQVACPAGPLGVQHIVGTSATFSCAACSCAVTGTCAGTVTMYSDTACTKNPTAYSTGTCDDVVGGTGNPTADYNSYKYAGGAVSKVKCTATAGAAQNVALNNETTICCAQ